MRYILTAENEYCAVYTKLKQMLGNVSIYMVIYVKKKAVKSTPLHCTKYISKFIKCYQEIVMQTQNYIP